MTCASHIPITSFSLRQRCPLTSSQQEEPTVLISLAQIQTRESIAQLQLQMNSTSTSPLSKAVEEDRPDIVRSLLESNKYTLVSLTNALSSALRNARLDSIELVFEYVLEREGPQSFSLRACEQRDLHLNFEELRSAAVLSDNPPTLAVAVRLLALDMQDVELREYAASYDKSASLQFLLSGDEPGPYLHVAGRYNASRVVTFILSDGRTTEREVRDAIRQASQRLSELTNSQAFHIPEDRAASTHVLQELVSDSRISTKIGQVIYDEWTASKNRRDVLLTVATAPDLDLSLLDPRTLSEILDFRHEYISQTGKWSGVVSASIRESLLSPSTDLDLLLREIIVKRLAPEYYLKWLLARGRREGQTSQLLSSAARSLLSEDEVVHTSDEFSAYSGFLLFILTNTSKSSATQVLSILEREKASPRGVRLASALIGAAVEIDT